jgi:hypothetical protein
MFSFAIRISAVACLALTEMSKYVTGGRFVWTIVQKGQILAVPDGKYTVNATPQNVR